MGSSMKADILAVKDGDIWPVRHDEMLEAMGKDDAPDFIMYDQNTDHYHYNGVMIPIIQPFFQGSHLQKALLWEDAPGNIWHQFTLSAHPEFVEDHYILAIINGVVVSLGQASTK